MKLITLLSLIPITLATNLFDVESSKIINNECCDLTYNEINTINQKLRSDVHSLVQNDYFKHYQFNLDMKCPFFECQSICFSPGCQLDLDVHSDDYDYDVDEQVDKLGEINQDSFLDSLCPSDKKPAMEDDEWCDIDEKNGVIIDVSRNPERFTGYIPTPERNIWGMIYQNQLEGECDIEQKVFFQIISGFHSSVSTHLSNEFYNNITNSWEPNLELFKFKVGNYPERIENIYFNYALVIRALLKISPYLNEIKFNTLDSSKDLAVKKQINKIIETLPHDLQIFNEELMFENHEIKEEFKLKFKNVTRLMDCVTCDRCRLWGKIQSTGYATALKILFESPKVLKSLKKNEIKSLFNTFDRLTKSIESIQNFNYLNVADDEVPLDKNTYKAPSLENQQQHEDQEDFGFEDDREMTDEFDEDLRNNKTLKSEFYKELNAVNEALKFIFRSYINLPKNLFHIVLFKLNQWWNLFIGNRAYSQQESEEYLFKILN